MNEYLSLFVGTLVAFGGVLVLWFIISMCMIAGSPAPSPKK